MKLKQLLTTLLVAVCSGAWANYSSSTVGTTTTLTWDFGEYSTKLILADENKTQTYEGLTLVGSGTANYTSDYVKASDGFHMNGASSSTTRYIKYRPTYAGTLTVNYRSNNSTATDRITAIGTAVSTFPSTTEDVPATVLACGYTNGSTTQSINANLSANTDYYIFFAKGGQNIPSLQYVYTAEASDEPTSTSVSPTSGTIAIGGTIQLTGSFTGGSFTGEWVSDDEDVATVSNTGLVTGVAAGTAHITYQWTEDQSDDAYKATATITVLEGFNASDYDLIKKYDYTTMGNVAFTLGSSPGKIWNQANSAKMVVYNCTNEGLENLAVQAAYGEDSGDSKTYMRGWKIVNGSGLLEGNGAGRCAAICGIESGWVVEFNHTSGTNFYTKNNGTDDDGISKTLLWEESGRHIFRANADGMIGFELDKNNYIRNIKIYKTKTPEATAVTGGPATWDFSSAAAQTASGTIAKGSNTLTATDGSSTIIYYTNKAECKWNNDGNGYYLYGSGVTGNSNGRFFILRIASSGVLSLTTTGNNGTYTIKKCATASTSWNDGTDLTTITTTSNGVAVSGDIVYDAEKPYLLIGFPDGKLNTQKIKWEPNTISLTTSSNMAGWRAFYDGSYGYTLDANTKAYIATAKDASTVTLTTIEDIPAGTPVILKTSSSADSYKMTLTKAASTTSSTAGNLLSVSTAGQDLSGSGIYRLGYGAAGVGFYPWAAASASAGIVYVNTITSSRALSIVFEDETTGISQIENGEFGKEKSVYNLRGQRVAQPTKGLYIVNGKKVMFK